MNNKTKNTLLIISRFIIGILFIFSGFVKCVDPTGTAIKMEEYFVAFGTGFLVPWSMTFSILMCGIELLVGLMILFNTRMVWGIWAAVALMVFYTPLTLWLAITNKVTDCGCFGDAIKLNNLETFLKNVAVDIFLVFLLSGSKRFNPTASKKLQTVLVAAMAVAVFGFEAYNLVRLPVIDFMPYKVGTNIPQSMIIPEGAPQEQREYLFIYEKDGVQKKYTMNDLPDSTWKFVDRKEGKLIQKGYVPPIHDFMITTSEGFNVTDEILTTPGETYILTIASLKEANPERFTEINRIAEEAISKGHRFIAVSSSLPEEYEQFKQKTRATYPIYLMDGTTIKTMIRSNPGLMMIDAGTILKKWHYSQFKKIKVN
jgi:uncharacterized membrane protein YphA (DoxX/SURF4 family)